MIAVVLALTGLLVLQAVLRAREVERWTHERDRLTRLAFAESKAERITALLPERPAATERRTRPEEPPKPNGL